VYTCKYPCLIVVLLHSGQVLELPLKISKHLLGKDATSLSIIWKASEAVVDDLVDLAL
jgi:hypothetical protein